MISVILFVCYTLGKIQESGGSYLVDVVSSRDLRSDCEPAYMCPSFCLKMKKGCYVCDCGDSMSSFMTSAVQRLKNDYQPIFQTGSKFTSGMMNSGLSSAAHQHSGLGSPFNTNGASSGNQWLGGEFPGSSKWFGTSGQSQSTGSIGAVNQANVAPMMTHFLEPDFQEFYRPGLNGVPGNCPPMTQNCPSNCWMTDGFSGCMGCGCTEHHKDFHTVPSSEISTIPSYSGTKDSTTIPFSSNEREHTTSTVMSATVETTSSTQSIAEEVDSISSTQQTTQNAETTNATQSTSQDVETASPALSTRQTFGNTTSAQSTTPRVETSSFTHSTDITTDPKQTSDQTYASMTPSFTPSTSTLSTSTTLPREYALSETDITEQPSTTVHTAVISLTTDTASGRVSPSQETVTQDNSQSNQSVDSTLNSVLSNSDILSLLGLASSHQTTQVPTSSKITESSIGSNKCPVFQETCDEQCTLTDPVSKCKICVCSENKPDGTMTTETPEAVSYNICRPLTDHCKDECISVDQYFCPVCTCDVSDDDVCPSIIDKCPEDCIYLGDDFCPACSCTTTTVTPEIMRGPDTCPPLDEHCSSRCAALDGSFCPVCNC